MTSPPGSPDRRALFARGVLPALARERPRALLEALSGPGSTPFLARLWNECAPGHPHPPPVGLHSRCAAASEDTWIATIRLPVPAGAGDDAWVALRFHRRRGRLGTRVRAHCLALGSDGVLRDVDRAEAPSVARDVPLDEVSLRAAAALPR